ncbi:hypothetical protein MMC30_007055 [Trapelia coarctata]|nr:hypothetical protein [Trapelia coarctata]
MPDGQVEQGTVTVTTEAGWVITLIPDGQVGHGIVTVATGAGWVTTVIPDGQVGHGIVTVTTEGGWVLTLVDPIVLIEPTVPIVPTDPTVPVAPAVPEPIASDPVPLVEVYGAVMEFPGARGRWVADGITVTMEVGTTAGDSTGLEVTVPLRVLNMLVVFEEPPVGVVMLWKGTPVAVVVRFPGTDPVMLPIVPQFVEQATVAVTVIFLIIEGPELGEDPVPDGPVVENFTVVLDIDRVVVLEVVEDLVVDVVVEFDVWVAVVTEAAARAAMTSTFFMTARLRGFDGGWVNE